MPQELGEELKKNRIDLSNAAYLEKGNEYYLIKDGKKAYFVSMDKMKISIHEETVYVNAFVPTALMYGIFTLPLFIFVRARKKQAVNRESVMKSIFSGVKEIVSSRNTVLLMISILLGGVPVYAAVHFMSIFLKTIGGVPDSLVLLFLVVATVFSVIGGLIFGLALRPLGNKKGFMIALFMWFAILFVGTFVSGTTIMWIVGSLAGLAMGGDWAISRVLVIDIAPEGREGTYLSFYSIVLVICGLLSSLLWPFGVWLGKVLEVPFVPQRVSTFIISLLGLIGVLTFLPVKFPKDLKK